MKRKTKILAAFLAIMMLLSVAAPFMAVSAANEGMTVTPLSSSASKKLPNPVTAVESYLTEFFYISDRGLGILRNMPDNGFWTDAEVLEMFIDAYEQLGNPRYLSAAEFFYDGIIKRRTTDWSWNDYNDDVFWMSLATIRLYKNTQNEEYLNVAKANFDMCYERAWDTTFMGGGFWWRTDNTSKNGCVNGPGALAALVIYETTKDEKYLNIGKEIMEWEIENLFNTETGEHYDNININGVMNYWTNTGNQGNIIGPCTMLYKFTGEQKYFDYAKKAADHAATLGDGKYDILNEGADSGDTIGGKGLLARWLGYFIRECDVRDYDEFMEVNATVAWNNRNEQGLMWGEFGKKTVDDIRNTDETMANTSRLKRDYASWGCSAAVAWLLHTPGLVEAALNPEPTDDPADVTTAVTPAPEDDGNGPSSVNLPAIIIPIAAIVVVLAVGATVVVVVLLKKKKTE